MTQLWTGFRYAWRGVPWLWGRPSLWGYVAGPAVVTLLLIAAAAWGTVVYTPVLLAAYLPRPEMTSLLGFILLVLWRLLALMLGVSLFTVSAVLLWVVAGILASPVHEALSARVEAVLTGVEEEELGLRVVLADALRASGHSLAAAGLYFVVVGPLLVVNVVPVLGELVYIAVGGAATALFVARQVLDVPLTRRRLSFGVKLGWLRSHKWLALGFGAGVVILLWVPGLNLLSMPVAVVGGTLFVVQMSAQGHAPRELSS